MHIVQLRHPIQRRRIAFVEGDALRFLLYYPTLYDAASVALIEYTPLLELLKDAISKERLDYTEVYEGKSEWRLLPAFDHPLEPTRCFVTGTGLTHRQGAANRNAMHQTEPEKAVLTDSMKMFQWGEKGGRPRRGIGVQPEWFYKGNGSILRAHGEPLETPNFADDGGEEAELAAAYLIDRKGVPRRLGFATANEFSDHVMEKKNYLYLAPSKLRTCSLGPELVLNGPFDSVPGEVRIWRGEEVLWQHALATGEKEMNHSLANLEYHHFKYPLHRQPGTVHIHFFGTGAFSFGAGISLAEGDVMEIAFKGYGKPLRNPVCIDRTPRRRVAVRGI